MEKFFTINKDSDFYKEYVQYQKDVKANAQAIEVQNSNLIAVREA